MIPESAFTDADGDVLTYSAVLEDGSAVPDWLTFDPDTRRFSGTPPQDFNGELSLTVSASDGVVSATYTFTFRLNVTPVNDAPVLANAIADQSIYEDSAWSYKVPGGTFADVDGGVLQWSAAMANGDPLPSWLAFNPLTHTFSGTPLHDFNGELNLRVTASDGTASVSDTFTLTINRQLRTVNGTSGNDTLAGVAGTVSEITGGGGNDTITGGSRADVAVYSGNRSDYTITTVAGVTTVIDNREGSPDGTDTLRGMNILRFVDIQLFQSTAANKVTLAGQAQTYNVSNSEMVQGTNAAEHFIVAPKTSALVFVGNNDVVDLAGAIVSYSFAKTGTQLQISDGTYTTTLSVGGSFTLRTASGSTSVAIDFAAGGAIKLGGTQVVGSVGFNPLVAITNGANVSDNALPQEIADTTSAELTILGFTISGASTVDEGQSLTVTVLAEGVEDGTVIPYTLSGTGISANDIAGGLSGSFTVTNGQGSITIGTALDRLTEGNETLLVTLGGAATGAAPFAIDIADIGLSPVMVINGQSYTATPGKIDTFVIDASQSLTATIAGFETGDVLEFVNYSEELGVSFEQLEFGDAAATLFAGNATLNLTNLANDNFGEETSFEDIYGANAIGYVI